MLVFCGFALCCLIFQSFLHSVSRIGRPWSLYFHEIKRYGLLVYVYDYAENRLPTLAFPGGMEIQLRKVPDCDLADSVPFSVLKAASANISSRL